MLRVLSEEEARRYDDEAWRELTPGRVFYVHRSMVRVYFVAVERRSEAEWSVIELSPENTRLIIQGMAAQQSQLLREQVRCMGLA